MQKTLRTITAVPLALALAACAPSGASSPSSLESAALARPVSVMTATLATDGRSVRVDFIGGRDFDASDPCSVAYRGTAAVVGDELEIGVYAEPNQRAAQEGVECTAEGYSRQLTLDIDQPFAGNVVRDLAGQVLFLGPPEGLAEVADLPDGWELRRQGNVGESLTPTWERIWSPDADPWPSNGSSMLTLIQSFGGPIHLEGGVSGTPVEVNGHPATLSTYAPTGAITLVWSVGTDQLLLDGYLADFTREQFIAIAESVAVPAD